MIIQHNMTAFNSNRQLGITTGTRAKSAEKLSSGYKINRAADDAAGLAISEKMRRQIRGLDQASYNVQDGISYVQVADAALAEIDDMLNRMNELCIKAATETLTEEDRAAINAEIQQLKIESNRTFHTTSFNDKLIWDENTTARKQVGSEWRAMYNWGSFGTMTVTEDNKGVWPDGGFKFNVYDEDTKVKVYWKGYDGVSYESKAFDIPDLKTLKSNGLSLPISSTTMADENFPAARGITTNISLTLDEEVTREQFISKLKESTLTPDLNYTANTTLKMADNYVSNPNVTLSVSGSMTYFGGIASGKNLNAGSDSNHIKPNPTTGDNREGIDKFNFTLTKDVDTVSANSTFGGQAKYAGTVHVSAHDQSADKEGIWWDYDDAKKKDWHYKGYSYSSGDLTADIASALSGTANNSLINDSAVGGTITLNFDLKTTESVKYSYTDEENTKTEGEAHDKLGTISLTINVGKDATAEDVTDAIAAIKGIDIASTNANNSMGMSYGTTYYGAPVYGGTMALNIQAGSEGNADNVIPIIYDVLNNHSLKINDLNTTTVANAQKGIEQTKNAKTIVDEQRAVFGSYQNRMEHTYKNLTNVVENTQNAESLIRDTDMAAEMVRFSNNNILMQAGQSMLAQANQTNQGVISLLQ